MRRLVAGLVPMPEHVGGHMGQHGMPGREFGPVGAGSDVAPQSRSTGARGPGCRWMQAWRRPPLPNASPEPAKVTVTPSGPGQPAGGLATEPARDIEPELLTRQHGPQPAFQVGQAGGA